MITTLLIFAAFLFFGAMIPAVGFARRHTSKAWIAIAVLLPVLLLSVEQFVSLVWSYDIVARASFHRYFAEAPVMGLYAMLFIGSIAAAVLCLGAVIGIATITLWREPSRWIVLILACLPAAVLYASQHYLIAHEELESYIQAHEQDVRDVNVCRKQPSGASAAGCLKYIQSRAGESDAELALDGRNWVGRHHAKSELECQPLAPDYDPRPAFTVACRAAIVDGSRQAGKEFAITHQLDDPRDCGQGAQQSGLTADLTANFLEACIQGVHESLRNQGSYWALTQLIFDPAECRSGLPGTKPNADFVAGCESTVKATFSDAQNRFNLGQQFATRRGIKDAAECNTSLRDEPPELAKGCAYEVAREQAPVSAEREGNGWRWATDNHLEDPNDCKRAAQADEFPADFLKGCTRGVHEALTGQGAAWAASQFLFDPAKCQSRLPGTKPNADFVAGCESFVRGALVNSYRGSALGAQFVQTRHIKHVWQCYTSVPDAPHAFKYGCVITVHNLAMQSKH